MTIPEQVSGLLLGWPAAGSDEQAFPLITVDDGGYPHVALLSRAEMDVAPTGAALLAVIASTRTRANLGRDGKAALIAVGSTSAFYLKLQLSRSFEDEGVMGCVFEAVEFKEDTLGIPLIAMGFKASTDIARIDRWELSARILGRLAATGQPS
jgi:hypothetical protein